MPVYNEKIVAFVAFHLLLALNHIHAMNICHRDLKPENIMVDESWNIKILDFGLANLIQSTSLTEIVGTPYYVAPEVLKGNYSKECDMWSLGVIIFLMLCGHTPFNGSNPQELLEHVAGAEYQMNEKEWNSISEEAKDFVKKLLIKDPK